MYLIWKPGAEVCGKPIYPQFIKPSPRARKKPIKLRRLSLIIGIVLSWALNIPPALDWLPKWQHSSDLVYNIGPTNKHVKYTQT